MRIIAGKWRGRTLLVPPGEATRPTSDRAREALFSMLASRLGAFDGLRVGDLFAGTGALGLEALSRGAAHCTFVENDAAALKALEANIHTLDANGEIRAQAAGHFRGGPFDLIFLDPPYRSGLATTALANLRDTAHLFSLEIAKDEAVDTSGFETVADRIHGKARLLLLRPL